MSCPALRAAWRRNVTAFGDVTLNRVVCGEAADHTELKQSGRRSQLFLVFACSRSLSFSHGPSLSFSFSPSLSFYLSPTLGQPWATLSAESHKQREKKQQRERENEKESKWGCEHEGCPGKCRGGCFLTLFSLSLHSSTSSLPLSSETLLMFSTSFLWFTLEFPNYELPEVPNYICC